MPYKIVRKKGKRPWKIINKETGKVVGSSSSESEAKSSARARMAAEHSDWKPTGKRRKKK